MNDQPLISIIIPVYNTGSYLRKCLDSVSSQTYTNLEIIIVDDGSTDNSFSICQEYAFIDPRIVLFHKDNRGLSNARNFGIRHSHGDFIGFVDSDDYLPLDAYEKLLKGFEWETAYEIVVTNGMIIQFYHGEADQKSLMRAEEWSRSDYQLIEGRNMCQAMLSEQSNHYVHTKLYKKDVFKHIIFHEGRNDEDTIFTYELGKVMKSLNWAMVEVPSETYYYRIRPESICTSTTKPLRIDRLCNLRWILKDVKEEMPEIVELVLRLQVRTLLWFSDELFSNWDWLKKWGIQCVSEIRETENQIAKQCLSRIRYRDYLLTKYCPILRYLYIKLHYWHNKALLHTGRIRHTI